MPTKKKPRTRYPAIPKKVACPGGTVPVTLLTPEQMKKFADPGEELFGYFDENTRAIFLRSNMPLEQQHRTLWHELSHVGLSDSGITNGLGDGQLEEALCDAFASLVMRALYG